MTDTNTRPAAGIAVDTSRLRAKREALALSRMEVAVLTGVSRDCIAKIENGKRRPKPATLRALANALGTSPEDLIAV